MKLKMRLLSDGLLRGETSDFDIEHVGDEDLAKLRAACLLTLTKQAVSMGYPREHCTLIMVADGVEVCPPPGEEDIAWSAARAPQEQR